MIQVIRAHERHFTDFGWLKTYWLFSFAEYYDPANIQFGALRVFNDDVVAPHTGFGTHAHEEMEIITIVLDGAVTAERLPTLSKVNCWSRSSVPSGARTRILAGRPICRS